MQGELEKYLRTKIPGVRVTNVTRIPVGHSQETWFFDAEWSEGEHRVTKKLVLRRHQEGGPLSVGSDQAVEYNVMKTLQNAPVPVPNVYWLETDPRWLGMPFFVMDRLAGTHTTQAFSVDPALKKVVGKQFVEILAALHTLDWEELGLSFLGVPKDPEDCAARELEKWERIYRSEVLEPQPLLEEALLWLKNNIPKQVDRVSMLWGDVGVGNFLHKDGKITGLIDWELAHLGDPMDDVAYFLWRTDHTEELMDRQEFLESYERMSGIKVNEKSLEYYQILVSMKVAIMCHTGTRDFCNSKNLDPDQACVGLLFFPACLLELAAKMGW